MEGVFAMTAVALVLAALSAAEPPLYDPGLRAAGRTADSVVAEVPGRFGFMGLDLEHRRNFVLSEGGFFDCGSMPLLPVACAVCLRALPTGAAFPVAPDELILDAWRGDPAAIEALASRLGRANTERWLDACLLQATHLPEDGVGILPWTSTAWDCAVMLAWMDRFLPASGIPHPGAPTVSRQILEAFPADLEPLGCEVRSDDGYRGVFAVHLPWDRVLGLSMLADSLTGGPEADQALALMIRRLCAGNMDYTEAYIPGQ